MCFTCLLLVASVHMPPSDGNIFQYMPYTFKHIYSVPHVTAFLANKNSYHYLWSDPCISSEILYLRLWKSAGYV
jgi:hypothetical protein